MQRKSRDAEAFYNLISSSTFQVASLLATAGMLNAAMVQLHGRAVEHFNFWCLIVTVSSAYIRTKATLFVTFVA